MSPHGLRYRPAPAHRRPLCGYTVIALVAAVIMTVVVGSIVCWHAREQASTHPVRQGAILHAADLRPLTTDQGSQLLTDIRTEAFRAGYQAALEREGCAGLPFVLSAPLRTGAQP